MNLSNFHRSSSDKAIGIVYTVQNACISFVSSWQINIFKYFFYSNNSLII